MDKRPSGAKGFGALVANLGKLAGCVLALRASFFPNAHTSVELAISALMIAGAQGVETLIEKLFKG